MRIETARLVIRHFEAGDVQDLFEILGDEETMRYCEPAYDLTKTEKFLREFCIGRKGALAAELKETGKVIGYILFNESAKDVYEAGWFFNRRYWRRGYAFEAMEAVFEYAFENMAVHRIFSETIDDVKSVGIMEKLGMVREGIQRKHTRDCEGKWVNLHLYGLLEEDWQKR